MKLCIIDFYEAPANLFGKHQSVANLHEHEYLVKMRISENNGTSEAEHHSLLQL